MIMMTVRETLTRGKTLFWEHNLNIQFQKLIGSRIQVCIIMHNNDLRIMKSLIKQYMLHRRRLELLKIVIE